uniref:Uncharacterized protein n=1 Tax=Avena sativa TaxID=4498 RepID=A0ACD5ZCW4_AVESA
MGTRRSLHLGTFVLKTLLLLFNGVCGTHCSVVDGNTTDQLSLLDFKKAITDDPTGALSNWNDNVHHCMWSGVNCSTRHPGRVTVLRLYGLNLAGEITPSIGNLTFLRKLSLDFNRFSGQLPPLNRLRKLVSLSITFNSLESNILDAVIALENCSKIKLLDLSGNMLVGSIPRNIGSLSNIRVISLLANNLTGTIPPTFSNMTCLESIELGDNHLEGSIPEELGQLPNMMQVILYGNRLSGRIPATLFNLSQLFYLELSMNMFSGTVPSYIGDTLPSLEYLYLGTNKLEGHIPDSLGNASELGALDLGSNYFTGTIPSFLGKLHKLGYLNLDKNKLEARTSQSRDFLSALSNCSNLGTLSLYGNQLHGVLPNSVGNLSTTLGRLDLGGNYLSGTVPQSIGVLKNLDYLHLGGNNFVGTIPDSIGNLASLTKLYLSDNQFDDW